jgi:antitoxin VapB
MRQLNIKNEETVRLAKELSQITGENVTQAVTRALADRLEALRKRAQRKRKGVAVDLMAIGRECAELPSLDARSPDGILYGDDGLPVSSSP